MNEFEERMSALRRQFRAERNQITKDAERAIGHLNTVIGAIAFPEVRDALRAEKGRIKEAMRNAHKNSRDCYMQQLVAIEEEFKQHREKHTSVRQIRRVARRLREIAAEKGENSVTIYLADNSSCTITFNN